MTGRELIQMILDCENIDAEVFFDMNIKNTENFDAVMINTIMEVDEEEPMILLSAEFYNNSELN